MKLQTFPTIMPEQLRAARALLDWSRIQCGQTIGVSPETVRNIEMGRYMPSETTLEKIVNIFSGYGVEFFTQHGVSLKRKPVSPLAAESDGSEKQGIWEARGVGRL